jgi:hypothetical protein
VLREDDSSEPSPLSFRILPFSSFLSSLPAYKKTVLSPADVTFVLKMMLESGSFTLTLDGIEYFTGEVLTNKNGGGGGGSKSGSSDDIAGQGPWLMAVIAVVAAVLLVAVVAFVARRHVRKQATAKGNASVDDDLHARHVMNPIFASSGTPATTRKGFENAFYDTTDTRNSQINIFYGLSANKPNHAWQFADNAELYDEVSPGVEEENYYQDFCELQDPVVGAYFDLVPEEEAEDGDYLEVGEDGFTDEHDGSYAKLPGASQSITSSIGYNKLDASSKKGRYQDTTVVCASDGRYAQPDRGDQNPAQSANKAYSKLDAASKNSLAEVQEPRRYSKLRVDPKFAATRDSVLGGGVNMAYNKLHHQDRPEAWARPAVDYFDPRPPGRHEEGDSEVEYFQVNEEDGEGSL